MVSLTEKAKERLRFFLQEKNPNDWRVRIRSQGPDQFGFSLEEAVPPSPMDRVMEVDGFHLIFTEILKDMLEGATVDYIETEWSRGFKVLLEKKHEAPPQPTFAPLDFSDPKIKKIHDLLKDEINPAIASHGGVAELLAIKDNMVYLKLGGGCQGCASSQATLRNGIELRIKEEVPEIVGIIDETDHAAGKNPFYS